MIKEILICIIILVTIFSLDFVTQKYTKENIQIITDKFNETKTDIKNNNIEKIKNDIYEINKDWGEAESKMAFFLEHDELEKVTTQLKGITSLIETNESSMALSEIEKTNYTLEHLKEKSVFSLENVF